MSNIHSLVGDLQKHVQNTQDNFTEIQNIMAACSKQPLFERRDGKNFTVLALEERSERSTKRYADVRNAAEQISKLLDQNLELFGMREQQDSEMWLKYVDYVDGIVLQYLYKAVGCR